MDLFVCTRYHRRIQFIRYRLEDFDHFRDFARIGNDGFVCFRFAEISKFLEHFLCRAQIQRRLFFGVGKTFAFH